MSNYLGIDYGLVHIGLAVAESSLATPLPELKNDSTLFTHLTSLVKKYQISHLVLGLPTGPVEPAVRAFALELYSQLHLPVILHDETLSSHEAKQKLIEAGSSRRKRRHDHSYAAVLILEDYLESVLH